MHQRLQATKPKLKLYNAAALYNFATSSSIKKGSNFGTISGPKV